MVSSNGVPMTFATSQEMRRLAELETLGDDVYDRDVVLRTKPTLVRLSNATICTSVAWLLQLDGDTWAEMYRRDQVPYRMGVSGEGWFGVEEIRLPRDPGGGSDPEVSGWARLALGPLEPLPPHMILSSYDIGHPVVVTVGEFLGTTGMVEDVRRGSVILPGGAGHRTDAIAAIRTGTRAGDAKLAPMMVLLPRGSAVWVHLEDGDWSSAVISDYVDNDGYPKVELWLTAEKRELLRDRDRREIVSAVQPRPKATRVRGKGGVPSSKSPFTNRPPGPQSFRGP